jgi:hypothetical protein
MVEALLRIEQKFPDPAPARIRRKVEGLRGGAVVLMVAAFENYLKELVEEYLDKFTQFPLAFDPNKLPDVVRLHNIEQVIKIATENGKTKDRVFKISEFMNAATIIINQRMVSASFSDAARGNPNPEKVKKLFKSLGLDDFFSVIKTDFEAKWGQPVAPTFIHDTLQNVIDRRHEVAHTASVLSISRQDLATSLRFIKVFGEVCDKKMKSHIKTIFVAPPRKRHAKSSKAQI